MIDYSDDELESESDTDSEDEDDFPHLYANIPFPSRTPTDDDDADDFSHHGASTTTPPRTKPLAEIATNTSKALFELIKGPLILTPPVTPNLNSWEPESSAYSIFGEINYLEPEQSFDIFQPSKFDTKRELTLITALINDLGDRLVNYQELTDNIFVAALYNANPEPELLSLKSFCSWRLNPISDRVKNTIHQPPATQTIPDLRLIDTDGDVYSLEERIDILDEFEDRDFGRHLAQTDEWQFQKERWFLRNSTAAENEARLQHLERWYEEGMAK